MSCHFNRKDRIFVITDTNGNPVQISEEIGQRIAKYFISDLLLEVGMDINKIYRQQYTLHEVKAYLVTALREFQGHIKSLELINKSLHSKLEERSQTLFEFAQALKSNDPS